MELLIRNIKKHYEENEVLHGINLHHKGPGLICIVGPSGSGKSTLLNLIGCLDSVNNGQILIDGIDITKLNQNELTNFRNQFIGFVFQNYNLLKQLTVSENIRLSSFVGGADEFDIANELISKLGLSELEKKHTNLLSGGERQRVAIARALMNNPKLILADEPTGNLDLENSHIIFKLLKEVSKEHLVIVITHNTELAKTYADKIYTINDGLLVNEDDVNFQPDVKEFEFKKSSFYLKGLLRLSFRNLFTKKWQLFTTTFSLLVTLLCISILLSLRINVNNIVQSINSSYYDANILLVSKDKPYDKFLQFEDQYIHEDEFDFLENINNISIVLPKYSLIYNNISSDTRIIENNSLFKDRMQPYLIGEFPQNDNEIIVSMDMALEYDSNNFENIIGNELIVNMFGDKFNVKVSGIITTDTDATCFILNNLVNELKQQADINIKEYVDSKYLNIIYKNINETSISSSIIDLDDIPSVNLLYGQPIQNDNEVLISSQAFYEDLINITDDFSLSDIDNKNIDENLINNYLTNEQYIYNYGNGKVVGIYESSHNEIILSSNLYNQLNGIYSDEVEIYMNDLSKYKTTMDSLEKLGYVVSSKYENKLAVTNTYIHDFTLVFTVLSIITTGIAFVLLYILISNQIQYRINEFGILKALGTKKKDIILLLVFEGIIISLFDSILVFIVSLIITPKLNLVMNKLAFNSNYASTEFISNNIIGLILVFLIGILFTIIISVIPAIKASKLNPIDAINRG